MGMGLDILYLFYCSKIGILNNKSNSLYLLPYNLKYILRLYKLDFKFYKIPIYSQGFVLFIINLIQDNSLISIKNY